MTAIIKLKQTARAKLKIYQCFCCDWHCSVL